MNRKYLPFGAILLAILISLSPNAQCRNNPDWTPPPKLCSKDKQYCVEIVEKSVSDKSAKGRISSEYPEDEDRTLIISAKGKVLAEYPTFGYLLSVFWSPDGKYVAVNNRRANSGDYLWVISLVDGAAIKVPQEIAPNKERAELESSHNRLVNEISKRFPKWTEDELMKDWLRGREWKDANTLKVRRYFSFSRGPDFFYVQVIEFYRIQGGKWDRLPGAEIKHVSELTD